MSARTEFDHHVAVSPAPDGTFTAELTDAWRVGGGLNGGYLLAVVGSALAATLPGKPDPIAVSAHYLTPATPGPAVVSTRVLRDGRGTATVAADLAQDGQTRVTTLATVGTLPAGPLPGGEPPAGEPPADGASVPAGLPVLAPPADLPPRERCLSNTETPPEIRRIAPFIERFEMLMDPTCAGWMGGRPSGRGMLQAWFRLAGGRDPDPVALLAAVDALPPVTFDLGRFGWAPTLELTAYVRAVPAPGWLRLRHETREVSGGMFEEDCVVWDDADRVVAQSRQLARFPR